MKDHYVPIEVKRESVHIGGAGESPINEAIILESVKQEEEARLFLEDIRLSFPQVQLLVFFSLYNKQLGNGCEESCHKLYHYKLGNRCKEPCHWL